MSRHGGINILETVSDHSDEGLIPNSSEEMNWQTYDDRLFLSFQFALFLAGRIV